MIWFNSQETALKRSTLDSHAITSTTAMPLNSEFERVCMTSLMALYMRRVNMATSIMLCQSGCSKRLVNSAPMEVRNSRNCTIFATSAMIIPHFIIIQNTAKANFVLKNRIQKKCVINAFDVNSADCPASRRRTGAGPVHKSLKCRTEGFDSRIGGFVP